MKNNKQGDTRKKKNISNRTKEIKIKIRQYNERGMKEKNNKTEGIEGNQ